MKQPDGDVVISRHGKKFPGRNGSMQKEDVIPASWDDKHLMYITPEGAAELREQGEQVLGDKQYALVVAVTSDFIRAIQSDGYFKEGGVPGLKDKTHLIQRGDLYDGNMDWRHPALPAYGNEQTVAEAYIRRLHEDFYFRQQDGKLPCVAELRYNFLSSVIEGIEYAQQRHDSGRTLFTHFSHALIIDTLAMTALDALDVYAKQRKATVNERFRGHVGMGEMFTGTMDNLRTGNPTLELQVKGTVKGYTMRDLQRIQAQVYEHARA
ncbi:MAG TPA: histidine phosphatase family protein [Candidatus Nanoarchaeia archaeon]|nr:histidine phosphatase family protein [Candidatus Nanoarchaeia archaeon]